MRYYVLLVAAVSSGIGFLGPTAEASSDALVTAVYSEVENGYVRHKLPDGSFKRETYAIADGGYAPGAVRDRSIDDVKFPALAGLVAQFLARKNYFFARDTKSADLLLLVRWGTTIPFGAEPYQNAQRGLLTSMNSFNAANATAAAVDAAGKGSTPDGIQSPEASIRDATRDELEGQLSQMKLFDDMRRQADLRNARLLGYMREINEKNTISRLAGGGSYYDDLISDIESARYYVILAAYDFRAATQQHKAKLLWVTRVSIQAQGNHFDRELGDMLAQASRYFGRDSGRLVRQYQEGSVNIGPMKVLGVVPGPTIPAGAADKR